MALSALSDLHLHYQTELKAKAQLKAELWKGHEERFKRYCAELMTEDDTLVLVGDHSWGRNLAECGKDRGIRYSLVSGDCLQWRPMKVLE